MLINHKMLVCFVFLKVHCGAAEQKGIDRMLNFSGKKVKQMNFPNSPISPSEMIRLIHVVPSCETSGDPPVCFILHGTFAGRAGRDRKEQQPAYTGELTVTSFECVTISTWDGCHRDCSQRAEGKGLYNWE